MNAFVNAIQDQTTRTTNGMKARKTTANACVDLFYKIGASRGKNIIAEFTAAYVENSDIALRILQWSRDVRGGAGERQLFKQILNHLEKASPEDCKKLLKKIPEIGRIDDGFCLQTVELKKEYFAMLGDILRAGQNAKYLLAKLDSMSEKECQQILDTL